MFLSLQMGGVQGFLCKKPGVGGVYWAAAHQLCPADVLNMSGLQQVVCNSSLHLFE
jgi:hypothetical protein